MNVTTEEAELFAIRSGISRALEIPNINHIVVFTDSLHSAKCAIYPSLYHTQSQMVALSASLRKFFKASPYNRIEFWDSPEKIKWPPHILVDRRSKNIPKCPILPSKNSWAFSKKEECDSIWKKWQQYFQASNNKGNHFLDLYDDNDQILTPTYTKGGTWLRHVSNSNTICARLTRLITNHAPIGEYYQCFFPNKNPQCPCNNGSIETRSHILSQCDLYSSGVTAYDLSLSGTINFLKRNPNASSFRVDST